MDLGIAGRRALVCASSKGLGLACATALAQEGCEVTLNGRDAKVLESAAQELRDRTGAKVSTVAADLNTVDGRARIVAACPKPDILVNNNAGPPPGNWSEFQREDWLAAVESNMLAPILLVQAFVPGMRVRKFGRVVNITSAMVKAPLAHMTLSTAARAGLTAFCKAISREVAADNVTLNNLLPERIDTGRQKFMIERRAKLDGVSTEEARRTITNTIAAKRFGSPQEFASACAYLCSDLAGFISGQNVQVDGGTYPGLV
ncbi:MULTISPECIES: SDR family oxidoreductase [Ramlibacter]|uniref:SDR family oxidoreductase n=1 Tax=Ramlibacter pinisoli TaxID=2682844 RepID=A0A6N8ISS3_9BURK|nr:MULTISPECIES: SDR family oxidoreductase [Ramlibacter]MBA2964996.1 SDR family oxidoreductase [Ramlibacter sp. CGMCC 1.13660]MVQ29961.1 SDR family oxidoreductase [Ramlibacter pinisoli]